MCEQILVGGRGGGGGEGARGGVGGSTEDRTRLTVQTPACYTIEVSTFYLIDLITIGIRNI